MTARACFKPLSRKVNALLGGGGGFEQLELGSGLGAYS